jgi:hypothetical protein
MPPARDPSARPSAETADGVAQKLPEAWLNRFGGDNGKNMQAPMTTAFRRPRESRALRAGTVLAFPPRAAEVRA